MSVKHPSRGIWGWMLFDWAAQPFFTVVTTFIFGPYFVARMAQDPVQGQAAWGYAVAACGLMIAVLSPILGSIADKTGARKPWIVFFASIKIASLCFLWFAVPGSPLLPVLVAFSLAALAAEISILFNDSMMPGLVPPADIGRISNIAWGLGYLGGMVMLIFVVGFLAASPETGKTIFGLKPLWGLDPVTGADARITGPLAALWYLIFILPMLFFTPDAPKKMRLMPAVKQGVADITTTLREVRKRSAIMRFLIARMIYQDGVNALLALGGGFAAALFGWSLTEIGLFGILLNVVAIFGCLVASRFDRIFGSRVVVVVSVALLLLATIGIISTAQDHTLFGLLEFATAPSEGLFATPAEKAYLLYGVLIGLAFGPVQASSRSWFASQIPLHEAGRYFGIYALSGRATSFLAPFLVASMTTLSGSARIGMAVLVLFFALGLYLIIKTPDQASQPK